jgi:hypothetical protein
MSMQQGIAESGAEVLQCFYETFVQGSTFGILNVENKKLIKMLAKASKSYQKYSWADSWAENYNEKQNKERNK